MDLIKTSDITDPNIQMPWTGPIIDFLQKMNTQACKAMAYGMFGELLYNHSFATGGVPVAGCTKSGTGNTMFNGWIFWKDELYYFPGASGLLAYSDVPVFLLDETNDVTVGSVEFSDAIFRYVTKVRRLKVVDQVSGTGLFDMSAMGRIIGDVVLTGTTTATTTAAETAVPNTSFTTPNRLCDIRIDFHGIAAFGGNGPTTAEGGHVYLKNVTLASNVVDNRSVDNDMSVTGITERPLSFSYTQRNVPANTNFQIYIKRFSAIDFTIEGPMVTYSEITRPKMW